MIIGTVASARDLPVAIRMAQSVKQHMPSSKVVCGVMEASMPSEAFHCPYFDEVILMQDTGAFADMQKFFFQYTVQEAAQACKSLLVKYMYSKYIDDNLILYMDAETLIISPLEELIAISEKHPIILIGQIIDPEALDMDRLLSLRQSGIYHSGFMAFKRHSSTEQFLRWWCRICENSCCYDESSKQFADQDWLDHSHTLFDDVYSLRHPGYFVTAENLMERWNITLTPHSGYCIDGLPLRALRLSGDFLEAAAWIEIENAELYQSLFRKYSKELPSVNDGAAWSYSLFASGEVVSNQTKGLFRRCYYENPNLDNPFLLSNTFFNPDDSSETEDTPSSYPRINKTQPKPFRAAPAKRRRISGRKSKRTRHKSR
ncbi:hypothetical protein BK133_15370 [Paenibacillus sp. FSL H8-0548]|uniref:hypothetical protein n=1 Tax=Paenibacillus sp. FSL H8-0548 TaxID=1920422 RepID=UPI00096F46B2|nr:hypothetical protein [Paenibacillus sp. FSL H8-0548]OMF31782.1 hypothetical protein BK133_15370 [Paenibacillus sp. FSL H8-0548]